MFRRCLTWVIIPVWMSGPPALAQESNKEYRDAVQMMYIAYYGRAGDEGGVAWWSSELESKGGDLSKIIDQFGNSEEYQSRFANMTYSELVNNIYVSLFNRNAEEAGLRWYVEELHSGRKTLASIALDVASGASIENEDGQTVANRLNLAKQFTYWVDKLNLAYTTNEIVYARQLLDMVTSDAETVQESVNQFAAVLNVFPRLPSVKVRMTTNFGDIVLEMYHQNAPLTSDNFLTYVDDGFYNSTLIHRVEAGFVIQGGAFDDQGQGKTTRGPIINEANNGLSNVRGSVAMARTSDPDSAMSQYFINLVDNTSLDYNESSAGYAVFAHVTEGMSVVDQIANVKTHTVGNFQNVPVDNVIVISASREMR